MVCEESSNLRYHFIHHHHHPLPHPVLRVLLVYLLVLADVESIASSTVHQHEPSILHEVCNRETWNASCGAISADRASRVIVIRSATYGRMRLGRCVRKSYDYLGCAVDVRAYMDTRCSGRHSCSMRVPDDVLFDMQPCPPDLTSYLEISYDCVEVQTADSSSCRSSGLQRGTHTGSTRLSPPAGRRESALPSPSLIGTASTPISVVASNATGYLASVVSADDPAGLVGTAACPWLIAGLPGQRLNVTFMNFVGSSTGPGSTRLSGGYGPSRPDVCLEVAAVIELADTRSGSSADGARKSIMVCGGDPRESHVVLSQSHRLYIELHNPRMINAVGTFMIHYAAIGCPDVPYSSANGNTLTGAGWMRRDGDTTTIGCNSTSETWYMTCKNGHWIGDVINCSSTTACMVIIMRPCVVRKNLRQPWLPVSSVSERGVILMIVLGVAVGVVIGALLLCLIANFTKRRACNVQVELTGTYQRQAEYQGVVGGDCGTTQYQQHQQYQHHKKNQQHQQYQQHQSPPSLMMHRKTTTPIPTTPLPMTYLHDTFDDWPATHSLAGTAPGSGGIGCLYGRCRGGFQPVDTLSSPTLIVRRFPNEQPHQLHRQLPSCGGRSGYLDSTSVVPPPPPPGVTTFKVTAGCGSTAGLRNDSLAASFTNLI